MTRVGGMTDIKTNVPQEVHDLVHNNKHLIREKLGRESDFEHFEIESYATQVVAGINYFLRIRITNREVEGEQKGESNDYIHVRLFHGLDRNVQIANVLNKNENDKLEYF